MMDIEAVRHNISTYRSELMGLAIVLILIEHFQFFGLFDYGDLSFFASLGCIGVDIFLFLSGFGLLSGYSKYSRVIDFYKRRLLRILPTFAILIIIFDLVSLHPEYIISLAEWKGQLYNYWFISYILILYAVFPLAEKIQRRWLYAPLCMAIILSFFLTIFCITTNREDIHMVPMLMSQRLPIFFIGMLVADKRFSCKINIPYTKVLLILCVILLYGSYWILNLQWSKYIMFIPISIMIIILKSNQYARIGGGALKGVGLYTLEMYLISMFLMQQMQEFYEGSYTKIKVVAICAVTYLAAVLFHKMLNWIKG